MKFVKLFLLLAAASVAKTSSKSFENQTISLNAFKKEIFWDQIPSGLFQVDVGLQNLTNKDLMLFADINGDKYQDVVLLDSTTKTELLVYVF